MIWPCRWSLDAFAVAHVYMKLMIWVESTDIDMYTMTGIIHVCDSPQWRIAVRDW